MDTWGIAAVGYLMSLLGVTSGGAGCAALAGLDHQRSLAWASASAPALEALYVDPSAAAADVAALQEWRDRGLVLEPVMLVIGSCTVTAEGSDHLQLDVVDRLAPTWATDPLGLATSLPVDTWSGRQVVLTRVDGAWRYAEVSER